MALPFLYSAQLYHSGFGQKLDFLFIFFFYHITFILSVSDLYILFLNFNHNAPAAGIPQAKCVDYVCIKV
jgi:hypothetical protein